MRLDSGLLMAPEGVCAKLVVCVAIPDQYLLMWTSDLNRAEPLRHDSVGADHWWAACQGRADSPVP